MRCRSIFLVLTLLGCSMLGSCGDGGGSRTGTREGRLSEQRSYVRRVDTLGLVVLYPEFASVDLVCGHEPAKSDSSVILFAEAAYTGQCLDHFDHFNVAGDHVSAGERHKGFRCRRNTGAFVYYGDGTWEFCHKDYSHKLDKAAAGGGAAFGQELIIHDGRLVTTPRKDSNVNQFRALCEHNGRLCIIESDRVLTFGDFRRKLTQYEVSEAIYLDMGAGWNYAWYRDGDTVRELHPRQHGYCTNWITFYK